MKIRATENKIINVDISPIDAINGLREELKRKAKVSIEPNVIIIDSYWVWVDPHPREGYLADNHVIREAEQDMIYAWMGLDIIERCLK